MSIPAGIKREHVLKAIANYEAGVGHRFGPDREYLLKFQDRTYPSMAIIGLAARYVIGRVLDPAEFRSGVGHGQAVAFLRDLGFDVVAVSAVASSVGDDWSAQEVEIIVADYVSMLSKELQGQRYSKAEHNRHLRQLLPARSKGSIEFKHANISAAMLRLGLPYISGYKPRGNFQAMLLEVIGEHINQHGGLIAAIEALADVSPEPAPVLDRAQKYFESRPERIESPPEPDQPWLSLRGRRINFLEREMQNRRLGRSGEQWVVEVERRRLLDVGRDDLAKKVEWVADTRGDGLGFDVLSFEHTSDREQYVEVKTTTQGKEFPFYVTRNEVRCSQATSEQYRLYRVFRFHQEPRLFVISGDLQEQLTLRPVSYSASIG